MENQERSSQVRLKFEKIASTMNGSIKKTLLQQSSVKLEICPKSPALTVLKKIQQRQCLPYFAQHIRR